VRPNSSLKPWEITLLGIAKEEITEPMILLLLAVGFFYTLLADLGEALTLYAIIAALVLVEIANEFRAKKAISSLAALAEPRTKAVRDGNWILTEYRNQANPALFHNQLQAHDPVEDPAAQAHQPLGQDSLQLGLFHTQAEFSLGMDLKKLVIALFVFREKDPPAFQLLHKWIASLSEAD
jgi:hypothetical protein